MPIVRKVAREEAEARWEQETEYVPRMLSPAERAQLLQAIPDRHGISRIDHKATHSWLVRVYGAQFRHGRGKSFSDGIYDGPGAALQAAVLWRDAEEARLVRMTRSKGPRIQRVNRHRQVGYLAWNEQCQRRYFAVGTRRTWNEARLEALRFAGLLAHKVGANE